MHPIPAIPLLLFAALLPSCQRDGTPSSHMAPSASSASRPATTDDAALASEPSGCPSPDAVRFAEWDNDLRVWALRLGHVPPHEWSDDPGPPSRVARHPALPTSAAQLRRYKIELPAKEVWIYNSPKSPPCRGTVSGYSARFIDFQPATDAANQTFLISAHVEGCQGKADETAWAIDSLAGANAGPRDCHLAPRVDSDSDQANHKAIPKPYDRLTPVFPACGRSCLTQWRVTELQTTPKLAQVKISRIKPGKDEMASCYWPEKTIAGQFFVDTSGNAHRLGKVDENGLERFRLVGAFVRDSVPRLLLFHIHGRFRVYEFHATDGVRVGRGVQTEFRLSTDYECEAWHCYSCAQ